MLKTDRTFRRIWFQSSSVVCISSVPSNLVHPVPCDEDVPRSNVEGSLENYFPVFVLLLLLLMYFLASLPLCFNNP